MGKSNNAVETTIIDNPAQVALRNELDKTIAELRATGVTAEDIALRILSATTMDDILGTQPVSLKDVIGTPFTIRSISLHESDYEAGLPAYCALDATWDDDERVVITTGATTVVAQVIAMYRAGLLPARVSSRRANKPTADGYYPVSLCKAEPINPDQLKAF